MKKSTLIFLSIITINLQGFQITFESHQRLIDFAKTNVVFTRTGTTAFIQNCMNDSLYSRLFLPSCFDHLVDFLEFGKSLPQRTNFNGEVLNIFHQELKQTAWVNAFAFVRLLDKLPTLIDSNRTEHLSTKEALRKTVYSFLEQRFDELKTNPDAFLDTLSDQLLTVHLEALDTQETYALLLRFLEQACDKLIWSSEDKEVTWECFTLIGNQLERLHQAGLIPTIRKLNALYWSLVSRYAYFIESSSHELTLATIETLQKSLHSDAPSWLLLPEAESSLRSKKEYLEATFFEADFEVRRLA